MGKALYRKYRSKSLDEVVGQEHITTTLHNALKSGKLSHAYLLTGPRGVGKTSVARILAHELNGLKYDEAEHHLDIIEIDAASNRRIDEVRDLRDKVHILPTSAKYKVYIIDEVHMLTKEAFNALLKTLEEPPAHVIFILATTEAHKLPETIVSRTQHFAFKPISPAVLAGHLKDLAQSEKITIDDDALQLIAEHGDGSFRDSISLLDQVRNFGKHITIVDVEHLLGIAPTKSIVALEHCLQTGTADQLLKILGDLRQQGITAGSIAKQLGSRIRDKVIAGDGQHMPLLKALLDVPASPHAERLLELTLLETLFAQQPVATPVVEKVPSPTITSEPLAIKPASPLAPKTLEEPTPPAPVTAASPPQTQPSGSFTVSDWPTVLASLKKKHNTLYGILRMAQPELDGTKLTLEFRFAFHQKQLSEKTKQAILINLIKELFDTIVEIECRLLDKQGQRPKPAVKKPSANVLDTVSNIFGSAEMLESS